MYAVSKMGGDTLAKMFPFGGKSKDPKNLPFTSSTATETYGPNLDEFLKRFNPGRAFPTMSLVGCTASLIK
jgi:hypothetical protein